MIILIKTFVVRAKLTSLEVFIKFFFKILYLNFYNFIAPLRVDRLCC